MVNSNMEENKAVWQAMGRKNKASEHRHSEERLSQLQGYLAMSPADPAHCAE